MHRIGNIRTRDTKIDKTPYKMPVARGVRKRGNDKTIVIKRLNSAPITKIIQDHTEKEAAKKMDH
jgi:hypothetical protein